MSSSKNVPSELKNFNLEILKNAVLTQDNDTLLVMLEFLASDINEIKVIDDTDPNDDILSNCRKCFKLGKKSDCYFEHEYSFGKIKIIDKFQTLYFLVDVYNILDFLKLNDNKVIYPSFGNLAGDSITFKLDCIKMNTYSGFDSIIFNVGENKMKEIRQKIVEIILSWKIELDLFSLVENR